MANKRRWSRYQRPAEKRDETGQPVAEARPKAPSRPQRRPRPKPARTPKVVPPRARSRSGVQLTRVVGLLVVVASLGIFVAIILAASSGEDEPSGDVDTALLTEDFIGGSLADALREEGKDAVSVQLTEYGMTVEYFDPNTRESRYVETNDYTDGYRVRVEESYYDDYQPRPFDLSVVDAATMIAAVEEALTVTDDIYTYDLRIEADRETGEVEMVVRVSGDESVEITRAP